ncbi:unnamed protein product [Amoebophrya sp. A120]|nr:unnamed protein product [Amoebophrya sp. A120]|eukprot:GSA120T00007061001.1
MPSGYQKQVLMVAEKPSIAEALANALAENKSKITKSKRTSPVSPILEFEGYFPFIKKGQEKVWIKITSAAGHVYKREFTKEYLDRRQHPPIVLFDATTEHLEANGKARMPAHFKQEAKDCSYLVLWLDCDREGENICFEVMRSAVNMAEDENSRLIPKKRVLRAIFSALDEKSLQEAYWGLSGDGPNKNESDAVEARQELDLKIGCAWTRFQSQFFAGRYRDLDAQLISYGPCQTPTLWFCVQRHDQIKSFKPEKFYHLSLKIKVQSLFEKMILKQKQIDPQKRTPKSIALFNKYEFFKQQNPQINRTGMQGVVKDETIDLEWTKGPLFSAEVVQGFKSMLVKNFVSSAHAGVPRGSVTSGGSSSSTSSCASSTTKSLQLEVTTCSRKEGVQQRPLGMNTVTMLKLASSLLNIGPHEAMREAETLYLRGYLTYPRTETTAYPKTFDFDSLIQRQANSTLPWAPQAKLLQRQKPRKGVDAGDHPPITPTLQVPRSVDEFGSKSTWRLYDLITRNFLASVSTDLVFEVRKWGLTLSNPEQLGQNPRNHVVGTTPGQNVQHQTRIDKNEYEPVTYQFAISERNLIDAGFQRLLVNNFDEENYKHQFHSGTPYGIGELLELYETIHLKYEVEKDDEQFFKSNKRMIQNDCVLDSKEMETSPPEYLSESDLLALMDANGIGTDASMATHIQTIGDRNYVEITGGRRLIPTKLGIALVHGYSLVDNELCVPRLRQDMEASCTAIAKGEASKKQVVRHTLETFKAKFDFFEKHISFMDQLFQKEYEFVGAAGGLLGGSNATSTMNSLNNKGKGKNDTGPSIDELRELQRLGLGKGDFQHKLDKANGKGGKGSKKGKGKKGKDRDDEDGGRKGKGKRDRDDDYVPPDEQCYIASNQKSDPGLGIVVVSAKEKKAKELEKKLKEIDRLEDSVLAEGKVLDAAQKKKVAMRGELEEELRKVLGKFSG